VSFANNIKNFLSKAFAQFRQYSYVRQLWILAFSPFFLLFGLIFIIYVFGTLPKSQELENPKFAQATEIWSADTVLLGKYYNENRSNVSYDEISPMLIKALIATEDKRFYEHSGIDFNSLGRVVLKTLILRDEDAGGGSTLSQQLAKLLFPRAKLSGVTKIFKVPYMVFVKLREWIMAVKIERRYTKEEILTMYLNKFDFMYNAIGIKSASQTYFGVNPDSLKLEEAAMLVGMFKNPSYYNPVRRTERTVERRNTVLKLMLDKNYITEAQFNQAVKKKYDVKRFRIDDHNKGLATYFREVLRQDLKNILKDIKRADGEPYDIYSDGLRIITTIDSRMQKYGEQAAFEHLKGYQRTFREHWRGDDPWKNQPTEWNKLLKDNDRWRMESESGKSENEIKAIMKKPTKMSVWTYKYGYKDTIMSPADSIKYYRMFLQTGFMCMEPSTGFVKAWVGGINHEVFKYDHVNINTKRQVGSSIKPFLYALAISERGYSPCEYVRDAPYRIPANKWGVQEDWTPKNATDSYYGTISLTQALCKSLNTVSARLIDEIGPPDFIAWLRKFGFTSPIPNQVSICLGTPDISLYEMVAGYSVFGNKGTWVQPIYIQRIEDKNGMILKEFIPEKRDVLNEEYTYAMDLMLEKVVETNNRIKAKYQLEGSIGGKTGTTQNQSDGWFMGITPQLVAGVWVGCDDRYINFRSLSLGQGAHMAAPIWGLFMKKVQADKTLPYKKDATFERPKDNNVLNDNCAGGHISNNPYQGGASDGKGFDEFSGEEPESTEVVE